jgi:hypothetical protein
VGQPSLCSAEHYWVLKGFTPVRRIRKLALALNQLPAESVSPRTPVALSYRRACTGTPRSSCAPGAALVSRLRLAKTGAIPLLTKLV